MSSDHGSRLRALEALIVETYELARDHWSGQCFGFTGAPESMLRAAHETARDGFLAITQKLSTAALPVINAEYRDAEAQAALLRASASAPPEKERETSAAYSERVQRLRSGVYIRTGEQLSERVLAAILAYQASLAPVASASALSPDPAALREAANPPANQDEPQLVWSMEDGDHLVELTGFPNISFGAHGATREQALHILGEELLHCFREGCEACKEACETCGHVPAALREAANPPATQPKCRTCRDSGFVAYWDGSAYAGEGCPDCPDEPAAALASPRAAGRPAMSDLQTLIAKWRDEAKPPVNPYGDRDAVRRRCINRLADELETALAASPSGAAPREAWRELQFAAESLTKACEIDMAGPNTDEFTDDEAVGINDGPTGETEVTFGMIRRTRAALNALAAHGPSRSASPQQPVLYVQTAEGQFVELESTGRAWRETAPRGTTRYNCDCLNADPATGAPSDAADAIYCERWVYLADVSRSASPTLTEGKKP